MRVGTRVRARNWLVGPQHEVTKREPTSHCGIHERSPGNYGCEEGNRIMATLGMALPFPLWRLHSGPQSSSVDQCSETPPEHMESSVAEEMRRSVVSQRSICGLVRVLRSSGRRRGRSLVGSARTKLELGQPYWLQYAGEARFGGEKAPLAGLQRAR